MQLFINIFVIRLSYGAAAIAVSTALGHDIMTSMKQSQALDVMKLGHNVFLTGEPGTGKTHVLNEYIEYCRSYGIGLAVTASTGIAATYLNGMTIHSWSGMGLHSSMSAEQLSNMRKNSRLASRFKKTRVLIIDEISMLDGARLDLINDICKVFKDADRPFGGIQVILSGDLFQLPPVTKNSQTIDFVHTSKAWRELRLQVCYLHEQYRQHHDDQLLTILREIRSGEITELTEQLLSEAIENDIDNDKTTRLHTHNFNVDAQNQKHLDAIDAQPEVFPMHTSGQSQFIEQLKKSCLAPENLELKVGAHVLCVANNPSAGFMNGTRATVIDFDTGQPIIKLDSGREIKLERHTWSVDEDGRVLAEVSQYPLRLAWAITVHKSQGMNLDTAQVDLSRAFTPGMGYVALSRIRSLGGLSLRGINQTALSTSPDIHEFDELLKRQSLQTAQKIDAIDANDLSDLQRKTRASLASEYSNYDRELFESLRQWRTTTARQAGKPAYTVFPDKTLIALAAEQPNTQSELAYISGIGPTKLEKYGPEVIQLITRHRGQLF